MPRNSRPLTRKAQTHLGLLTLVCTMGLVVSLASADLALAEPQKPAETPPPPASSTAAPQPMTPVAGTVVNAFGTVLKDSKAAAHQLAPNVIPAPATADPNAKPEAVDPKKPAKLTEWAPIDIELGRARCMHILKGLDAVTRPEVPFRDGECGSPSPVRLISVGKNPTVVFDPPALVTCDLVEGLERWVKQSIQPIARHHLGGPVTKIEVMSDYSCRNALGRAFNRLSEHGKVNALDIRGFTTDKGKEAIVLTGWGKTRRDIEQELKAQAQAAEAAERIKAEAEKAERAKSASKGPEMAPPGKDKDVRLPPIPPPQGAGLKPSLTDQSAKPMPPPSLAEDIARRNFAPRKEASLEQPNGPRIPGASPAPGPVDPKVAAFLRETHDAACQIFGTTIGPEANERHRNHFHVDMAERKIHKICDD